MTEQLSKIELVKQKFKEKQSKSKLEMSHYKSQLNQ